jgi:hypothetical protein
MKKKEKKQDAENSCSKGSFLCKGLEACVSKAKCSSLKL